MNKDFYTVRDISKELHITERKVRKLLASGEIKAKKVAGKYITTKEALQKYIES